MSVPDLPAPSARDAEVRAVCLELVQACQWREAIAVMRERLSEIAVGQERQIVRVFRRWSDLERDSRPDFLTYAHRRRRPGLEDDDD